jgi:hypothetical protein
MQRAVKLVQPNEGLYEITLLSLTGLTLSLMTIAHGFLLIVQ